MSLTTNAAVNLILQLLTGASMPQSNWEGEAAPDVTNDRTEGYSKGSYWYDLSNGTVYICSDDTEDAAAWNLLNPPANNGVKFIEGTYKLGGRLTALTTIIAMSYGLAINSADVEPDASAILDVQSTTKGLKVPVMSAAQRDAIASPAKGLIVYSNTDDKFYGFNGTIWTALS